jgi:hypothetical protein
LQSNFALFLKKSSSIFAHNERKKRQISKSNYSTQCMFFCWILTSLNKWNYYTKLLVSSDGKHYEGGVAKVAHNSLQNSPESWLKIASEMKREIDLLTFSFFLHINANILNFHGKNDTRLDPIYFFLAPESIDAKKLTTSARNIGSGNCVTVSHLCNYFKLPSRCHNAIWHQDRFNPHGRRAIRFKLKSNYAPRSYVVGDLCETFCGTEQSSI